MSAASPNTGSADVLVICAGAMHRIMDEAVSIFERSTGFSVAVEFASSGGVKSRILAGQVADVIITTQSALDELIGAMKVDQGGSVIVARSPIGVAVRANAAKPDISTTDAFKSALLQANSIAYADPATGSPSANHLVKLLDRLGLTSALKPKTRLIGATPGSVVVVCDVIARGEAEIGIQQISEILGVAGVELVGPLPPDLQHLTVFSAAVGALARDAEASREFVAFLTSPAAGAAIEAMGMIRG